MMEEVWEEAGDWGYGGALGRLTCLTAKPMQSQPFGPGTQAGEAIEEDDLVEHLMKSRGEEVRHYATGNGIPMLQAAAELVEGYVVSDSAGVLYEEIGQARLEEQARSAEELSSQQKADAGGNLCGDLLTTGFLGSNLSSGPTIGTCIIGAGESCLQVEQWPLCALLGSTKFYTAPY